VDLDAVREALELNLLGAWQVTQAFVPLLRRSDHPRIINVSSTAGSFEAGLTARAGTPAYGVAKAALNALTVELATELKADGVLLNAVCPGYTATAPGGGRWPARRGRRCLGDVGRGLPNDGPTGGFFRDGKPLSW
jgi:NAD(P)-dependent dehydrogenase (short-subunit alcohol dehydrogenase family)